MEQKIESIDRTGWLPGPWDSEPDREEWRDEATGFPCLTVRNPMGAWCGYVGVPPGHPYHGVGYDDVAVDIHGGLTYADKCQGHICHAPRPGESDDVWWLGFDCAHLGDAWPSRFGHVHFSRGPEETYRDLAYVKTEVRRLAQQLAAI